MSLTLIYCCLPVHSTSAWSVHVCMPVHPRCGNRSSSDISKFESASILCIYLSPPFDVLLLLFIPLSHYFVVYILR
ncbi:hypothetical protein SCHPADRAFT_765839 [Schizopora paradoxa]|uniref:Uncharacterized protein n=1 Tax=Schizopora paradoxa TaxID=27342 RepID=A0A0H2QX23_9AGAM|nr:hypothetical protein SCHPADRAFT_765839 [Schizopora paradoxa]